MKAETADAINAAFKPPVEFKPTRLNQNFDPRREALLEAVEKTLCGTFIMHPRSVDFGLGMVVGSSDVIDGITHIQEFTIIEVSVPVDFLERIYIEDRRRGFE